MFSIRYMLSSKAADVINSLQLVIDLLLPGEGGLELIESLQMIPKYRNVPVIVMSGIEEDKKIDKRRSRPPISALWRTSSSLFPLKSGGR